LRGAWRYVLYTFSKNLSNEDTISRDYKLLIILLSSDYVSQNHTNSPSVICAGHIQIHHQMETPLLVYQKHLSRSKGRLKILSRSINNRVATCGLDLLNVRNSIHSAFHVKGSLFVGSGFIISHSLSTLPCYSTYKY
jgi:hypothetical protein